MWPRPSVADGEQFGAGAAERVDDGVRRQAGAGRDLVDRLRDIEKIAAAELALRILRRVAVRLDAEPPPHHGRIIAGHGGDLAIGPDVERAFGLVRADGSPAASGGMLSASSADRNPPSRSVRSRIT